MTEMEELKRDLSGLRLEMQGGFRQLLDLTRNLGEDMATLKANQENQSSMLVAMHKDLDNAKTELHKLELEKTEIKFTTLQYKKKVDDNEGHCKRIEADLLDFKKKTSDIISRGKGVQWALSFVIGIFSIYEIYHKIKWPTN